MQTKKLRIAMVSPLEYTVPPKHAGGTERVIADLCDALVALGHDVTLFAADGSLSEADVVTYGAAAAYYSKDFGLRLVNESRMLKDVLDRADEFDIIHCHTELLQASILQPVEHKVVTTLHWLATAADRQALFHQFPRHRFIAISNRQAADIPTSSLEGIVHHGLSHLGQPVVTERSDTLIFIGRLTDQKQPDVAIDIARRSGSPLLVAGNIDIGNPNYFDSAVKPMLDDKRRYIGEINDSRKANILRDARALLMPINWNEPFGLTAIEALLSGTPVIAYAKGALPEIVDHGFNGFLVSDVDEACSAVTLCEQLDPEEIAARARVRFGAARMARDYVDRYFEIRSTTGGQSSASQQVARH